MADGPILVRDVMRIGVPTCKVGDPVASVAAQMLEHGATALVVLDEDGDARGWISEERLAAAYLEADRLPPGSSPLTAEQVLDERIPECPSDIPLASAVQIMADQGVDHLFFLHRAGGRAWPASVLALRDVVRALAGPQWIQDQGTAAPRPSPMDLFRQRHGLSQPRR